MIIHLSIIILAIFFMYMRTFKYSYIIDDLEVAKPKEEETKNKWRRLYEHFRGNKYTDSKLAHQITTILHIVNCILIYFVFGHNEIAFLTALLFGLNPVTNQVSIWLSGRPYGITTFLLLLGLLFIPLMPFVYGYSILFSPNSLSFPLIFLIQKPHWYIVLLPLVGYYFSKRFRGVLKSRLSGGTDDMTKIHPKKIILVFKTLGYYFMHCLLPLRIGMCHAYLQTFGLTPDETKSWYKIDKYFWLGVAIAITSIYSLFHATSPLAYGFLWFVLLTVQFCNLIMVNHPITERYIYLPTIGLMYMLANLAVNTPFIWVFLTFYVVRLYYFMPAYFDIKTFWKSNTENFPSVAMGYNQYGLGLINFGNTGSAIDTLLQGVQLRPHDFRLNYNLANIMLATGNTHQAIGYLKTAEVNLDKKNNWEFWTNQIKIMKDEIRKRGILYVDTLSGVAVGSQA